MNEDLPCEQCKHYYAGNCTKPKQYGSLTSYYELAKGRRVPLWDGEDDCGIEGRYWEPKLA